MFDTPILISISNFEMNEYKKVLIESIIRSMCILAVTCFVFKNKLKCCLCDILFTVTFLFILQVEIVSAFPLFYNVDKICSLDFEEISYRKSFELLTGIDVPAVFKLHSKLYTGFKFHKSLQFEHRFLKMQNILKITYCQEGKIKYQVEQPFDVNIDWQKPCCFYGGGILGKTFTKTEISENLDSFHCFKMARRKKYINKVFDIYLPQSWIGGIFYCDLSNADKLQLLKEINGNMGFGLNSSQKLNKLCHINNTIPFQPLYASDVTNNWSEYHKMSAIPLINRYYKMQVEKLIPFFATPTLIEFDTDISKWNLNSVNITQIDWKSPFKLQMSNILNMWRYSKNMPWFSEIEVQEKYHFTEADQKKLDQLSNKLLSELEPILNKPQKIVFSLSNTKENLNSQSLEKTNNSKHHWRGKIWNRINIKNKVSTIFSGPIQKKLRVLKESWKSLDVSRETFYYSSI